MSIKTPVRIKQVREYDGHDYPALRDAEGQPLKQAEIVTTLNSIPALVAALKEAKVKLEDALPYIPEHIPRCGVNAAIETLTEALKGLSQ